MKCAVNWFSNRPQRNYKVTQQIHSPWSAAGITHSNLLITWTKAEVFENINDLRWGVEEESWKEKEDANAMKNCFSHSTDKTL